MVKMTLAGLQRKYYSALYSYFKVVNLSEAYEKFKADPTKPPVFQYGPHTSVATAPRRLASLEKHLASAGQLEKPIADFLDMRIAETQLLKMFWEIKESRKLPSDEQVDAYVQAQIKMYGPLSPELCGGILTRLSMVAAKRGGSYVALHDFIAREVNLASKQDLYEPSQTAFDHYRKLIKQTFKELYAYLASLPKKDRYTTAQVVKIFEKALQIVGADELGWQVVTASGVSNVLTSKLRKRVIVGTNYSPMSTRRLAQVIAHEVGTHVQRTASAPTLGQWQLATGEEGLAVVCEQLLEKKFRHKRMLRYLAISLAVGVDGKPRNFCEVYEILWRAARILSANSSEVAKKQAFYETARAFRGGLPSARGMVYLKDKLYLEQNLNVWRQLERKPLDPAGFKHLFGGQ